MTTQWVLGSGMMVAASALLACGDGGGPPSASEDVDAGGSDASSEASAAYPPFDAAIPDGPPPTGIAWTNQTHGAVWPGWVGWLALNYDTYKHRMLLYGVEQTSVSIYSTTLWAYDTATNQATRLGGNTNLIDTCPQGHNYPADAAFRDDTPTWPGNRHPYQQMAWDTRRARLWLSGGVCDGYAYEDMYYWDSTTDTMHQTKSEHYPTYIWKAMAYDPDDDALFMYGYDGGAGTHNNWIYCMTDLNPTPGTLTAAQAGAGCIAPDDWSEVTLATSDVPPGWVGPTTVYDSVTKKVILYGGGSSTTNYNQIWAYDVPTRTWANKNPANPPPPDLYFGTPAMAYDSRSGKVLYHQVSGAGAPADWLYDPKANTWSTIASTGNGFVAVAPDIIAQSLTYDSDHNVLVGWSYGADIWQGALH